MTSEILIFLTVLLLVSLFLAAYVLRAGRRRFSAREQRYYAEKWQRIRAESDFRHAVLDADKLLDILLKRKGYSGRLGEKLKKAGGGANGKHGGRRTGLFSDLDGVWAAHKMRNRIAHELDARLKESDAQRALAQFERAYRDLGLKL